MVSDLSLIERVKRQVVMEPEMGCWLRQGALHEDGYGLIWQGGRTRLAHRFMYEAFFGAIPEGCEAHHICKSKNCCNPGHLMVVSHQEHMELTPGTVGYDNRAKTRCKAGHPFDEANTRIESNGARGCLACRRQYDKARPLERNPARSKTQCVRGHPFDEANTYISPKGERRCRICDRAREKARRERVIPQAASMSNNTPSSYLLRRGKMTPEQIATLNARTAFNARERRRRDPEKMRVQQRRKYARQRERNRPAPEHTENPGIEVELVL